MKFIKTNFSQVKFSKLQQKAKMYLNKIDELSSELADDDLVIKLQETLDRNVKLIQELYETSIEVCFK